MVGELINNERGILFKMANKVIIKCFICYNF